MLAIATLSPFSMHPLDDHADRVGFLITCILAFVAFQFIVSSSLPMTPYLTLLDKYTLASFLYLTVVLCTISVLARADMDMDQRIKADNVLFFVSAGIVLAIQLWFFVSGYAKQRTELAKLKMSMVELDDKNSGEDDSPVNVYGASQMRDCETSHKGDPFCSFEGLEKQ